MTETALFGAGCFWGVQDLLRKLPGVESTEVGYAGGEADTANYNAVKSGETGHAEVVQVKFDPAKVTYAKLLEYFFRLHDPTTAGRQGGDVGSQYRSVIFYYDESQEKIAREKIREIDASGKWPRSVVTEVVAAPEFYSAEDYHQDYLVKNPGGYTCHYLRP